jgi:parvulin-like peptidyl-prolyl isomerase
MKAWLIATGLSMSVCAAAFAAPAGERVVIDRAQIVVDDKMVTKREVQITRQLQERDYRARFKGEELERKLRELDTVINNQIIETLLLEARAETLGIRVSDDEIDERVNSIIQRDPRISGAYTDQALRQFVVKDLLQKRVVQREVISRIFVAEKAIRGACREEVREGREIDVGHILVRGDADQAAERIAEIQSRLKAGVPFEEVALAFSEDPAVKRNKGRLGFISKGQFVEPFEKAAFALAVGEVSKPTRTKFGLHVIKTFAERLKEKIDCDRLEESVHRRLKAKVWERQRDEEMKKYLEKLRKTAEIVVLD